MKIFFKIIIGVLITTMVASCFVFVFNTDLSKLKFWEKDTSTDVNDDTSNTDTNKPGDSTDTEKPGDSTDTEKPGDSTDTEKPGDSTDTEKPGDSTNTDPTEPSEEKYELSGSYIIDSSLDFSSFGEKFYNMTGVTLYFYDATSKHFGPEYEMYSSLSFSKTGIFYGGFGGGAYIYSVETSDPSELYGCGLRYLTFDAACETDEFFYNWFEDNFVKVVILDDVYRVKADADFSTIPNGSFAPIRYTACYYGFDNGEYYSYGDIQDLICTYEGITCTYMDSTLLLHDASTKEYPEVYIGSDKVRFVSISPSFVMISEKDEAYDSFKWFLDNFEPYVAPEPEPQDIVLDGKYQLKANADFSTVPQGEFILSDYYVGFYNHSEQSHYSFANLRFQSGGISADYMSGSVMLYDAYTRSNSVDAYGFYDVTFEYIRFDSKTISADDTLYESYQWFVDNFEPYVEPTIYEISGNYKLKSDADFSALTESVRLLKAKAYFENGDSVSDGGSFDCGYSITVDSSGIYYGPSIEMGAGFIYKAEDGSGEVNYRNVVFDYISLDISTIDEGFYNWFCNNFTVYQV